MLQQTRWCDFFAAPTAYLSAWLSASQAGSSAVAVLVGMRRSASLPGSALTLWNVTTAPPASWGIVSSTPSVPWPTVYDQWMTTASSPLAVSPALPLAFNFSLAGAAGALNATLAITLVPLLPTGAPQRVLRPAPLLLAVRAVNATSGAAVGSSVHASVTSSMVAYLSALSSPEARHLPVTVPVSLAAFGVPAITGVVDPGAAFELAIAVLVQLPDVPCTGGMGDVSCPRPSAVAVFDIAVWGR
jgi:hypothetical protein